MIETLSFAASIVALYYALRAGGPSGILAALRDPRVPLVWKLALALCLLPIPGPVDSIAAVLILRRIARARLTPDVSR